MGQTNLEGRGFWIPVRAKPEDSALERNPFPGLAFSGEALVKPKRKLLMGDQVSADHARVRHFDGFYRGDRRGQALWRRSGPSVESNSPQRQDGPINPGYNIGGLIPGGMVTRRVCYKSQVDMTEQTSQAPSLEELIETITELTAYRERLYDDVVGLGKKLRLSQKKIDATIKEHPELTRIDAILTQLKAQRDTQESQT